MLTLGHTVSSAYLQHGNGHYSSSNDHSSSSTNLKPSETKPSDICLRGDRAVVEMMNRSGMIKKADEFFENQPAEPSNYYKYFSEKIRENKDKLPKSPNEKDYKRFAHDIFAIYRREIVEKACKEVEANPAKWTFSQEEWKNKKAAFQDFIWAYAKTPWSGATGVAVEEMMKEEFPSLKEDFYPAVDTVILPPEQEDFYPGVNNRQDSAT